MNKSLLIKNIAGKTTKAERRAVNEWVSLNKDNEAYYISLTNLIVYQDLSKESNTLFSKSDIEERFTFLNKIIESSSNKNWKINSKRRNLKRVFYIISASAAAVLLFLSILLNIYQFNTKEHPVIEVSEPIIANNEVINTFYTDKGVKGKVVLEDSTVVWLNSASKICYPNHFGGNSREIQFDGEGYFEVYKDSARPMVVITPKGMSIKVLGTKFHVKSYNNDETEQATLFSGKIVLAKKFRDKKGNIAERTFEMIPKEVVVFDKNGVQVRSHNADTIKKIAWKRGELLFEETPMPEVMKMLERWFGAKFVVSNNSVLNYRFTGLFDSESLVQIMELLKFTSPIDYKIDNNTVYLKIR